MKCCFVNPKSTKTCEQCEYNFINFPTREILYVDAPDIRPKEKPGIKLGETIGENPNSFSSIKKVLKDIVKQCKVGKDRCWLRVGFDGVPYRMASEIIENYVVCNGCGNEFEDKESFLEHAAKIHPKLEPSYHCYFENVFLAVGAGHMEKKIIFRHFSPL